MILRGLALPQPFSRDRREMGIKESNFSAVHEILSSTLNTLGSISMEKIAKQRQISMSP